MQRIKSLRIPVRCVRIGAKSAYYLRYVRLVIYDQRGSLLTDIRKVYDNLSRKSKFG